MDDAPATGLIISLRRVGCAGNSRLGTRVAARRTTFVPNIHNRARQARAIAVHDTAGSSIASVPFSIFALSFGFSPTRSWSARVFFA